MLHEAAGKNCLKRTFLLRPCKSRVSSALQLRRSKAWKVHKARQLTKVQQSSQDLLQGPKEFILSTYGRARG